MLTYISKDPKQKAMVLFVIKAILLYIVCLTRFLTTILVIKHIASDTVLLDKFHGDLMEQLPLLLLSKWPRKSR